MKRLSRFELDLCDRYLVVFTLHHSWKHRCKLAVSCALSLWQICRVSPCTTHGSIAVNMLHDVHCLCGRSAGFHLAPPMTESL
ncbi:hypothetical protein AVEN_100697-1 [Araneus ventricosus]|uniref:Uncharacterized protein n=1 Tax=Araneus ventricosus TaxID=182803 RepID=A0A4Y2CUY2_ARAVE|nr:hypothetical protein AVEN_100697-1 [Araneus ventricosus]